MRARDQDEANARASEPDRGYVEAASVSSRSDVPTATKKTTSNGNAPDLMATFNVSP